MLEEIDYFEMFGITAEDFIEILMENPEIEEAIHDPEEGSIYVRSSLGEVVFLYRRQTSSGNA